MIKTAKHPSGDIITFEDKWHTYKSQQYPKKKFISGTKFLSQFFTPFDGPAISKRYAAKHNMIQQDVLNMWARKGEVGREVGTLVHNYIENILLGKKVTHLEASAYPDSVITESALERLPSADLAIEQLLDCYEQIETEKIIASHKHDRAGMVDILAVNKSSQKTALLDWKTNAKINFDNRWQSGLAPIQHLDDCSYNKYSLQMNLYEFIMIDEGYKLPGDYSSGIEKVIVHILDDTVKYYPCTDIQKEIRDMLAA